MALMNDISTIDGHQNVGYIKLLIMLNVIVGSFWKMLTTVIVPQIKNCSNDDDNWSIWWKHLGISESDFRLWSSE